MKWDLDIFEMYLTISHFQRLSADEPFAWTSLQGVFSVAMELSGPGRLHTDTRLLQGFLHWIANQLPWKQQEVKSLVVGTNDGAEACHLVGTKTLKFDGVPYCTLFFFGLPSCPCSLAPCCRNHRKSQKHPIVRPIAMVLVWINIFLDLEGTGNISPQPSTSFQWYGSFLGFLLGFLQVQQGSMEYCELMGKNTISERLSRSHHSSPFPAKLP